MIPLRDENPTTINPYITYGIMLLCISVYIWEYFATPEQYHRVIYGLGFIPGVVVGHQYLPPELTLVPKIFTSLTALFLHSGWLHLASNMLFLWIFGNNIEEAMGRVNYLIFYLVCGILSCFGQAAVNPNLNVPLIGASGPIAGVMGAYLMLFPHARVVVFIPVWFSNSIFRIKSMWVLGFWILIQFFNSLIQANIHGGTAWYAHMSGFVIGMVLTPLFRHPQKTA